LYSALALAAAEPHNWEMPAAYADVQIALILSWVMRLMGALLLCSSI
jgi:hypothetical protein